MRKEDLEKLVADPFLEERLKDAQERAVQAASGVVKNEIDLEIKLRCFLADFYNMPIMHRYFERPIDDLAFEAYLIVELNKQKQMKSDDLVRENIDEASDYASEGWEDFDMPPPLSDEEKQKMSDFMNTNQFVGEQK
jgi:hypothetical protein